LNKVKLRYSKDAFIGHCQRNWNGRYLAGGSKIRCDQGTKKWDL